jgi:hypothetical protein
MAKTPEVRIKVHDLDRLMSLTDTQLNVWLYYKCREGSGSPNSTSNGKHSNMSSTPEVQIEANSQARMAVSHV